MTEQETLFGDDRPEDLELGVAQRAVMRKMRRLGSLSRAEVGAVVHAGRGRHPIGEICQFCGVDGEPVLESLIACGLVERRAEADYGPVERAAGFLTRLNATQEETA